MPVNRWQRGRITGTEGFDFVTCRICGNRRRVISGRHLSKHDTDRLTYMDEYELSPDELIAKAFRVIQSGRAAYEPYGKRQWTTAIKNFYRQKGSVWATDLQQSQLHHLYSQGVWIFGDWYSAVTAAGLDPEKLGLHTFWNKDRVIGEIQKLRRKRLPLYPVYVMKSQPELFSAANRHYRSWSKALRAARVRYLAGRSRIDVLCKLREAMESGQAISNILSAELEYYFGSVEKAKDALKTDKRLLNRWSKQKILNIIARQENGDNRRVTIWRKTAPLVSAPEKRFGTGRIAVKPAGVM